jgi:hypothetical protein
MAATKRLNQLGRLRPTMVLLLIGAGCASAATIAPSSGIEGLTIVDSGCPPAHGATPCPDRPLPARLTVTRAQSGHTVAEARSDAAGRFRIALPPGRYVVHATNLRGDVVPAAAPQTCRVRKHAFTTLTVHFDSGVR